ncbi:MAG: ribonuclease HII [Candidatus Paceibacterota bacterium]
MTKYASCRVERGYLKKGYEHIIGIDEVGRGAVAGPVAVGVAVSTGAKSPKMLADSKLLSQAQRQTLLPGIKEYTSGRVYVGLATNSEVDSYGITVALRLAAFRALPKLKHSIILLDGVHNWLDYDPEWHSSMIKSGVLTKKVYLPEVKTIKGGDRKVSIIAAASVYAKEYRDSIMRELSKEYPHYSLERNKGYLTSEHTAGVRKYGLSSIHRESFINADAL